jgi:hypothetical protein
MRDKNYHVELEYDGLAPVSFTWSKRKAHRKGVFFGALFNRSLSDNEKARPQEWTG